MLRKIVCEDKRIITINGTDYDLSYILPNMIAMAIPTNGITKQWRNSKEEIAKFLEERHQNYMIYNLTEKSYNSSEFDNRVQHVGFLDHHPPRFNHLLKVIGDIVSFLNEINSNVACIHCRAGRGRTGLVCSCALLGLKICSEWKEAMEFFASRRSKISKGSTSPPQRRYCSYFYYYLRFFGNACPYPPIPEYRVYLTKAEFFNYTPNIFSREFTDIPKPILMFTTLSHTNPKPFLPKFTQNVVKKGEGHFVSTFHKREIYCDQMIYIATETKDKTTLVGRILINAFFINEKMSYTYTLETIHDPTEGVNKNQYMIPKDFYMKLYFSSFPGGNKPEDEQLHNEFVQIFDEFAFDPMEPVALPPPLPSKSSSSVSNSSNITPDFFGSFPQYQQSTTSFNSSQQSNQMPFFDLVGNDTSNTSNTHNIPTNGNEMNTNINDFFFPPTQTTIEPTTPQKTRAPPPPVPKKQPKPQVSFAPKTFNIKKDHSNPPSFL